MTLITVSYQSKALHKQTTVNILFPMDNAISKPVKVLWALHGMTDDQSGWLRRTTIEEYAEKMGVCVVMPNADLSFYVNMAYGADYFTFISEELPEFLSRFLPISRAKEDNYITGNSMGGYGAFYTAMKCPQKYQAAVSLSGPMNIAWINRVLSDTQLAKVFGTHDETLIKDSVRILAENEGIPEKLIYSLMEFGDECTARTFQAMFGNELDLKDTQYDIYHLAEQMQKNSSPVRLIAYCGEEDYHYSSNILFRDWIAKTNLDYVLTTGKGSHDWTYWNKQIPDFMEKLFG